MPVDYKKFYNTKLHIWEGINVITCTKFITPKNSTHYQAIFGIIRSGPTQLKMRICDESTK